VSVRWGVWASLLCFLLAAVVHPSPTSGTLFVLRVLGVCAPRIFNKLMFNFFYLWFFSTEGVSHSQHTQAPATSSTLGFYFLR
jgi:hypothetical protein